MTIVEKPVLADDATITLQLPPAMVLWIAATAEAEGRSVDEFILSCLEKWMPYDADEYRQMSPAEAQAAARVAAEQAEVD